MTARRPPPTAPLEGPQGRIVAHRGVAVEVELDDGTRQMTRVARRSGHVVGDRVVLRGEGLVRLPRESSIRRLEPGGRDARVVVANVRVLAAVVAGSPPSRPGFLERVVVAARAEGIVPLVVVTKTDVEGTMWVDDARNRCPDVDVYPVATPTGAGIDALRRALAQDAPGVLIGPSGVGKSTLTNALFPEADLLVGAVSEATGRGRHTTTVSTLHRADDGLELIDTPGIRDFGLVAVPPPALARHWPGFSAVTDACRFRDCVHDGAPGCAVDDAVRGGTVHKDRVSAYRRVLEEIRTQEIFYDD